MIPMKAGVQVLLAEPQVLLPLAVSSLCTDFGTWYVRSTYVPECRGGWLFANVNGLSAVRCLLLLMFSLHIPDPSRRSLLHACCLPPQVLGLSRDCSERDVTRAYRKQVPPPLSVGKVGFYR